MAVAVAAFWEETDKKQSLSAEWAITVYIASHTLESPLSMSLTESIHGGSKRFAQTTSVLGRGREEGALPRGAALVRAPTESNNVSSYADNNSNEKG